MKRMFKILITAAVAAVIGREFKRFGYDSFRSVETYAFNWQQRKIERQEARAIRHHRPTMRPGNDFAPRPRRT